MGSINQRHNLFKFSKLSFCSASSLRPQFTNLQVWVNNETVELSLSRFAFNYSFTAFHLPKPKMPKRGRTKKTAKATESVTEPQPQTQAPQFIDLEIQAMQRQIGAIRVVRDVEIEHLLTELRFLRSRFGGEELRKPVLQVFEESLPNLAVVVNGERNKNLEVKWRETEGCNDGVDLHASLLQRLSIASIPRFPGFEYSTNEGRMSFIGADDLHFKDIALEEPSNTQTLAVQEDLQTPGVTSQRLSVGMTPKTLRLPKPGEMLLSVHGSPLGVYKDNNMEAIHESEEVECHLNPLSSKKL